MLFYLLRKLAKYTSKGSLIWERPIKNEIMEKYPNNDRVWRDSETTIRMRQSIFHLDTTPGNNVVISHVGGGCMFSGNGDLKKLITLDGVYSLNTFKVIGNKLINILLFGEKISIYQFKEE